MLFDARSAAPASRGQRVIIEIPRPVPWPNEASKFAVSMRTTFVSTLPAATLAGGAALTMLRSGRRVATQSIAPPPAAAVRRRQPDVRADHLLFFQPLERHVDRADGDIALRLLLDLAPDGGAKDVFVHISAVQAAGLTTLKDSQQVSFDTEPDRMGKGPKAVDLQVTS